MKGLGGSRERGSGLGGLLPEAQKGTTFSTHSQDSHGGWVPCSLLAVGGGGGLTLLLTESAICPILQELSQDSEGIPVVGHEQSLRALGGPSRKGLASMWNWGLLSPPQNSDGISLSAEGRGCLPSGCWGAEERVEQTQAPNPAVPLHHHRQHPEAVFFTCEMRQSPLLRIIVRPRETTHGTLPACG